MLLMLKSLFKSWKLILNNAYINLAALKLEAEKPIIEEMKFYL
jgi:hypothetical protein